MPLEWFDNSAARAVLCDADPDHMLLEMLCGKHLAGWTDRPTGTEMFVLLTEGAQSEDDRLMVRELLCDIRHEFYPMLRRDQARPTVMVAEPICREAGSGFGDSDREPTRLTGGPVRRPGWMKRSRAEGFPCPTAPRLRQSPTPFSNGSTEHVALRNPDPSAFGIRFGAGTERTRCRAGSGPGQWCRFLASRRKPNPVMGGSVRSAVPVPTFR